MSRPHEVRSCANSRRRTDSQSIADHRPFRAGRRSTTRGRKKLGGSWMTTVAGLPQVTEPAARSRSPLDVKRIRADFPILQEKARGKTLVYLDNAATSQKPKAVIDAITAYYEH